VGGAHRRDRAHGDDVAPPASAAALAQKKSLIAQERDEASRRAWRTETDDLDPHRLVFLDETSTPTRLTPLRARAPRNQRALGRVPRGRWQTATLLATLTPTGMGPAMLLDGAADRLAFEAFVAEQVVPSLAPGQTVILDNLSVHQSARARDLIAAAGCARRFLPTYSPDFNPIEPAFAKLKQHLRRAEARTFSALCAAVGPALDAITPTDAAAFYAAAGFDLTDPPGQPLRRAL
jgi:transposase